MHPTPAKERRVRSGTVELCVAEQGDPGRPTVVLVHGYPDSKEVWDPVAERLADRFHVVRYDVRGHGRSTAPEPLRGGFTLEKLTDDFLAVADAVSPGAPVHLVGHDWGSVQSWEFVTVPRARARIASFTSMSGPGLDHMGHWFRERLRRPTPGRAAQLAGQALRSWYVYLLQVPALPELAWRGPLGRRWPGMVRRAEGLPAGDGFPADSLPSDAAHGAWLYRDNAHRMRAPRADAFTDVPVQLVVPERDVFLSPHLFDGLERWAPNLLRRSLPVRHWLPRTRPDQLAVWIGDFVTAAEESRAVAPPRLAADARRGERRRQRYARRFGGSLVLVTGAASGIGQATVFAFARAGARVVAVDRDGAGARRTARAALRLGAAGAWAEETDVSDADAMARLAERTAATRGVVDILVNNAGIGLAGPFLATTPEEWRAVLDTNLWGVIHGCRLFGGQMAERGQGGHIVNTASAAAFQPSRVLPAYGASKAAVLLLSESLRAELAGRGIGVSAVCPGFVTSSITSSARFAGSDDAGQERHRARVTRLYGLRNYPPMRVAYAILDAVDHNRAVVPVTPEARAAYALSRLLPGVPRALARVKPPM
ncbi:SDR family oxidoreductase [Streptomyces sp. NPDC050560]|uniref:SDR family oxidoreductase n=1 Tax=Streptomyces sp. NPDC050560 TaxID=3365630 RepID=UPI0037B48B3E